MLNQVVVLEGSVCGDIVGVVCRPWKFILSETYEHLGWMAFTHLLQANFLDARYHFMLPQDAKQFNQPERGNIQHLSERMELKIDDGLGKKGIRIGHFGQSSR